MILLTNLSPRICPCMFAAHAWTVGARGWGRLFPPAAAGFSTFSGGSHPASRQEPVWRTFSITPQPANIDTELDVCTERRRMPASKASRHLHEECQVMPEAHVRFLPSWDVGLFSGESSIGNLAKAAPSRCTHELAAWGKCLSISDLRLDNMCWVLLGVMLCLLFL